MPPASDYCPFCNELADPAIFAREQPGWPFASRIVHRNDRAFVLPGIGPQVYPYFLILTRRHTLAMASATPAERAGVLTALDWLVSTGLYSSPELTVFEHGGCGGTDGSSCLDHAHVHVIDGQFNLLELFRAHVPTHPATLSVDDGLPQLARYVFIGRYDKHRISGYVSEAVVPRQYCRRLLATIVGGAWNWRLRMHEEWVLRSVSELRSHDADAT